MTKIQPRRVDKRPVIRYTTYHTPDWRQRMEKKSGGLAAGVVASLFITLILVFLVVCLIWFARVVL